MLEKVKNLKTEKEINTAIRNTILSSLETNKKNYILRQLFERKKEYYQFELPAKKMADQNQKKKNIDRIFNTYKKNTIYLTQ